MLLRAFSANRKSLLLLLLAGSLAVGILEGLFILIAKKAVTGAGWQAWTIPLTGLALIVTARTLAQIAVARLEIGGVSAWLRSLREGLLQAAATRAFPAYRRPWRNTLVTACEDGLEDLSQGIGAGFRCLAAVSHILVLAPLLFLFSWKLAAGALALAAPALLAGRLRAGVLAASGRRWSGSKAALAQEAEAFAEGLESHAGNGRMDQAAARLGGSLDRHADRARSWETAKAVFPPALEWFFFMALAGLALAGAAWGGSGSGSTSGPMGALGLLPFGALLLLMYRPIREWARISEWNYRSLCIEIAKSGYRTNEPEPMERETSQLLTKVLEILHSRKQGRREIAESLSLSVDEINALTFQLTKLSVVSGAADVDSMPRVPPKLRLV